MKREGPERASTRTGVDDADAPLVARARAGDRAAFDALVERHLPAVWRIVYRVVRHPADAEDVAQETFLAAWQALSSFRGDARFSTWLHQVAVSRALNHLDRAAERLRRASRPLERPEGGGNDAPGDIDAGPAWENDRDAHSPFAALEARELRARLARCLEQLPAPWRVALALRDGEGLSYEEIARVAKLALGTVRSRLARARVALRECLEAA